MKFDIHGYKINTRNCRLTDKKYKIKILSKHSIFLFL